MKLQDSLARLKDTAVFGTDKGKVFPWCSDCQPLLPDKLLTWGNDDHIPNNNH